MTIAIRSSLSISNIHVHFCFLFLCRAQTLDVLLSSYYGKKKRFLISLVNQIHRQLGAICLASLNMDGFELWMLGNVLSQCIKKGYYLVGELWRFVINAHYFVCISAHPSCIFDSCIALNKILCFIKGSLRSVCDRDIDCPRCLLTLKQHLVFYLRLF